MRNLNERVMQYDVHVKAMAKVSTPALQLMRIVGIDETTPRRSSP